MTRRANARIAGFTLLLYIAAGIPGMILMGRATGGEGIAAQLASIARHVTDVRISVLLDVVQCASALVLGVAFYSLTREQDADLATLGLVCRVGEGVLGATGIPRTMGALWLATTSGAAAPDPAAAQALGAFLLRGNVALVGTFFAAGSALFALLLLRGRMIPIALAWLGVFASALLVVALPLATAGLLRGPWTAFLWLPMAAFEIPLALWLMIRGVAPPAPTA